ncbi:MAG: hypothetical protein KBA31_13725 [Alphaproteobacteria bacterium]|nr:hypothetical protein [Alphaproteobacteria bacterium]
MWSVFRKRSLELTAGMLVLGAVAATASSTTNRQVIYAPCMVAVVQALKADPAAVRFAKLAGEPIMAEAAGCDAAEDVAREANRAIIDLLINDATLFARLPGLLKSAGMECRSERNAIHCTCQSEGPFAILNPLANDAKALVDLPLPLNRSLVVAAEKRGAERAGKLMQQAKYVVAVSYRISLFDVAEAAPALTAAAPPTTNEVVRDVYGW